MKEESSLVVAAVQLPLRPPNVKPVDAAKSAVALMKNSSGKSDLYVLPELAPIGYSNDTFERYLPISANQKQVHKDILEIMAQAARDLDAHVCFGTIGILDEKDDKDRDTPQFTIRQVVLDNTGTQVFSYDKIYLCDYGDCSETCHFCPPPNPRHQSFTCKGFNIGILICADMRYPTYCRQLVATQHLHVVLQPVAFSRDCSFYTWRSLRETRAVENSVYWVGVNYAGDRFGNSNIVGPWVDEDNLPQVLGRESGVLVDVLSKATLQYVRTAMPFYKAMRSEKWT